MLRAVLLVFGGGADGVEPRLRLFHQRSLSPVQGPALNPFSDTLWKHRKPPDLWSCVPRTGFGLTHLEVGASSKNEGRYFLLPRLNQRRIQACRYTNKKRGTYIPTYTCSIVLTAIPLTEAMLASRIVPVTPAPTSLPIPSSQALITAWGVHNKRMASEEWGKLSDAVQLLRPAPLYVPVVYMPHPFLRCTEKRGLKKLPFHRSHRAN